MPAPRPVRSSQPPAPPRSVRGEYERLGAQRFYETHGSTYRNPHEPIFREAITEAVKRWEPKLDDVLDLAAGSGEATLILKELGARHIDAIDPYTFEAYQARTGRSAERYTFADIAAGELALRRYSLVVCSFALHLCDESRLPGVAQALAIIAPKLLILTPHKRPQIRAEWGWELSGEFVIERVRARLYRAGGEELL